MLVSSPKPLWAAFEAEFCFQDNKVFPSSKDIKAKRREWLRSIDLDRDPLTYLPSKPEFSQAMRERTELAWNDFGQEARDGFIRKAEELQSQWISTWAKIEDTVGFSLEKVCFGENRTSTVCTAAYG